jgi:flagellar biogenesis protein FliO
MAVTFFFAFVAGLALIGVAAWLVRRFASNRLGANPNRGRMPRLAVIDAAAVDGRRRLVLVRRDNIEHLLMIGGPTDIVVESNIVRAVPARDQLPQRPGLPGVTAPEPRITPLPGTAWSETEAHRAEAFDHHEPQMPEPTSRPVRPSFAEELRRPSPVASERRGEQPPGIGAESLSSRAEPKLEPRPEAMPPRMPSRAEPAMPRPSRWSETPKPPPIRAPERAAAAPSPPSPPPSSESADQNLAEMAQRLEAALRRPAAAPGTDTAPPVAPEAPPRDRAPQSEQPAAPSVPPASPKSSFENLEDEMASLLGRSKSP